MPECSKCREDKPDHDFNWRNRKRGVRHTRCRQCTREWQRKWTLKNLTKERLRKARYMRENPHVRRKADNKYRASNPSKRAANTARYRARKVERSIYLSSRHAQKMKDIYARAADITASTGIPHEVDHLIPLKGLLVSGLHVPWNVQIIPAQMNRKKSNDFLLDSIGCAYIKVPKC